MLTDISGANNVVHLHPVPIHGTGENWSSSHNIGKRDAILQCVFFCVVNCKEENPDKIFVDVVLSAWTYLGLSLRLKN